MLNEEMSGNWSRQQQVQYSAVVPVGKPACQFDARLPTERTIRPQMGMLAMDYLHKVDNDPMLTASQNSPKVQSQGLWSILTIFRNGLH